MSLNRSRLLCVLIAAVSPAISPAHASPVNTRDTAANDLALAMLLDDAPPPSDDTRSAEHTPLTIRFYWENDGALQDPFDGYDRHYTNGIALVVEHQPEWAQKAAEFMPFGGLFENNHGETKAGVGYVLGQLLFTPAILLTAAPIPTDQPYAGYLYGGMFWQRQGERYYGRDDIAVLDHFEINLGVVGPSAMGEDVQEYVHENFEGDDPMGWDNQLADEPTGQFYYRRKWRVDLGRLDSDWLGGLDMQLIPQAGVALGSVYRYAEAAATFRIGHKLLDDFGPGRINDPQSATGDAYKHTGWSWYAFARVGGRLVEHDLFLDGSTTDDPSLSVDKEPAVAELQGGFSVSYRPNANHRFEFTWGVTYMTDNFDAPGATGTESYGTWVLTWVKSF